MQGIFRKILSIGVLGLLASSSAYTAGYKMEFQSVSVLGDAGEAAVIEDAGTNWYNSAGLVYLPQQLVGSLIDLSTRTTFTGSTTAPNAFGGPNYSSGNGSTNSNQMTPLPAIHYSLPFKERFAVGLSIVPAWGLAEDFGQGSMLRYNLTRIYTKTVDIAPSIAVKINDKWSVGAGPDFNYLSLQSKFNIRSQGPLITNDLISRASADAWNTGWHLGALFRLCENTRFGLNYRSKIVMYLKGTSGLFGIPPALATPGVPTENNSFSFHWVLPPTTTFSVYHDFTSRWALMGTIAFDQWSTLRNYNAQNFQTGSNTVTPNGQVPVSLYQGFKNTFDLSVGTHYQLNEKWMLRGSVKYEPTPTGDQYRDVSFPDAANKLGFHIGSRFQMTKKLALDLIYGHVFTKNSPIRPLPTVNAINGAQLTGAQTNGHTSTSIDLLGLQLVWNI